MSLILTKFRWQFALVAIQSIINKRNTRNPLSFSNFSMRLEVILTTSEVPHEVTPIHKVYLITKEEAEVLTKSWAIIRFCLSAVVIAHFLAFNIRPRLVGIHMVLLSRVHTWEEHLKLVHVFVARLVPSYHIAVFLPSWCRSILRMTLLLYRYTHIALHIKFHRSIVCLSVEQWCITILLTVEVVFQREDIIRRVLIHWRICRRTNHNRCIASIANHHHSHHHSNGIQPTCGNNIFLQEQYNQHCDNQHNSYHSTLFYEWHTSKRHRQYKGDDSASVDSFFGFNNLVTFPYCPYQCTYHQHQIDCQSRIERTT